MMKKLINKPEDITPELLEGYCLAGLKDFFHAVPTAHYVANQPRYSIRIGRAMIVSYDRLLLSKPQTGPDPTGT